MLLIDCERAPKGTKLNTRRGAVSLRKTCQATRAAVLACRAGGERTSPEARCGRERPWGAGRGGDAHRASPEGVHGRLRGPLNVRLLCPRKAAFKTAPYRETDGTSRRDRPSTVVRKNWTEPRRPPTRARSGAGLRAGLQVPSPPPLRVHGALRRPRASEPPGEPVRVPCWGLGWSWGARRCRWAPEHTLRTTDVARRENLRV